jgi:hypothetical protein
LGLIESLTAMSRREAGRLLIHGQVLNPGG